MSFNKASLRFTAETFVTVGCLSCPNREVLEYGQKPDDRPEATLRAGLVAAARCALLRAQFPEGHMPPHAITQTVGAIVKIDEEFLSNGMGGVVAGVGADLPACPPGCAERVAEVADSIRGAVEEDRQG